jgi:arsenite methyltransferase
LPPRPSTHPPTQSRCTTSPIARFGIDAPYILGTGLAVTIACAAGAAAVFANGHALAGVALSVVVAALLVCVAFHLHTTLRGKFVIWDGVLDELDLSGDERVLDIGCGRGAVLVQVAKRLTTGRAVGIDLWRVADQSGNSEAATRRNLTAEGVAERVEVLTADMTDLPFPDASFDVVLSSIAIHNVPTTHGRAAAISEAIRVLRPGGRLVIVDIKGTNEYRACLYGAGITQLGMRDLGWRAWWTGPWVPTKLITATKPRGPSA